MKKFYVETSGLAPLLQARHLTPIEEKELLTRKSGTKQKVKELTDQQQFDIHAYKTGNKFSQPAEMFEAAMVKAAVNFKLEGKKTFKDVIKGGLFIEPIDIIHEIQDTTIDARWGRNKNTGGAVWVVRPKFDNWKLSFTINLLQDERVSPEVLKEILAYAGLYVGIGAWRPKFGRFEVIKFEEKI
mgnify:FL=1